MTPTLDAKRKTKSTMTRLGQPPPNQLKHCSTNG
jgi:hypothetical protein